MIRYHHRLILNTFFLALILLHDDSTEKVLHHVGTSREAMLQKFEKAR
jgi:hypothetical protein